MIHLRRLAVVLLLLGGAGEAGAQFATVRGRVLDADDDGPLPGASVLLISLDDGSEKGVATGAEGFYAHTRIPPGRYVLSVSYIGYSTATDTLALDFDDRQVHDVYLEADRTRLNEVVVETDRSAQQERSMAGQTIIRPSQLERVPMPDVSADLAAYLLTIPGFVAVGDRGGQLFVRGGTPTQNLVLIDGMLVYQPFHIVGFYSAFPADIVSHVDVYAGGFGARYGGRISSVIDVVTRPGNNQRPAGSASIAPFLSAVRLELPLMKGEVSVLASARESIIERVAPGILGEELPFHFGDRFLKFHASLNRTSSFSATALRTFDEGNIGTQEEASEVGRSAWRNEAYGARYLYLPPDRPVMTQLNFYVSRLSSVFRPTAGRERTAEIQGFQTEILFLYLLGESRVDLGIFASTSKYKYDLGLLSLPVNDNVSTGGGYVDAQLALSKTVRLEPSFRVQSFSKGLGTTLGPRLRLRWRPEELGGRHQLSAAWGLYHQQIVGLNNEQNVSDIFTVWAPTPSHNKAPRAMHLIAGWEGRFRHGLTLGVEGYTKHLANVAFPRPGNLLSSIAAFDLVDGVARGVDVKLEILQPSFYAGINYSLASVNYEPRLALPFGLTREEDLGPPLAVRFPPPHDRRHQLNVMAQVARGPYRFNVRWQFGTGLPFTQVEGYYEALPPLTPADPAFHTQAGTTFVARAALYEARLPSYHRLDLSAERVFGFDRVQATLHAGLINVYNRGNLFDYNFFTGNRINQLPLIPSLGLKVEVD